MLELDDVVRSAVDGGHDMVHLQHWATGEWRLLGSARANRGSAGNAASFLDDRTAEGLRAQMRSRCKRVGGPETTIGMTSLGPDLGAAARLRPLGRAYRQTGTIEAGERTFVFDEMVDPRGQDSWTLHLAFSDPEQLDRWLEKKLELTTEFMKRYGRRLPDDVELAFHRMIDTQVALEGVDLDAFARDHGLEADPAN